MTSNSERRGRRVGLSLLLSAIGVGLAGPAMASAATASSTAVVPPAYTIEISAISASIAPDGTVTTSGSTVTTITGGGGTTGSAGGAVNPLAGRPFYVDRNSWAEWARTKYPANAADLEVIAGTAQARWFGDWNPTAQVAAQVDSYVGAAAAAGAMPVLTLYAIPGRDCGGYSQGGLADPAAYQAWIAEVVRGIKGRPAAVVVEPDALTAADCLTTTLRDQRYGMIRTAVEQLTAVPATAVYIDAGHSRWLTAEMLATRLKAVGVDKARGFSLNVSNFLTTAEQITYGEKVSALVGGRHYVVDTSRNGLGPAPDAPLNWCNPAGRALGSKPTSVTEGAHADAYLWIKRPGESDGDCDRGDPVSGTWFNSYAVGLVQRAKLSVPGY